MANNDTEIVITAKDLTDAAFKSASAGLNRLGAEASSAASSVAGLFGLGGAAGAAGMVAMVKTTIDAADALNDLSQRLGISVEGLAKYELAAKQSGTSMESIAKGVKGLATNMLEHGEALKAAGVTAKSADGALQQLSDIFAAMPDGMEKAALATKLFGKAGMDLIPMLNIGSKGLGEAAEKSAKYAAAMAILAPQADAFNDSVAELSLASKIAGINIANELLPHLLEMTNAMAVAAKEGGLLTAAWVALGGIGDAFLGKPRRTIRDMDADIAQQQRALDQLSKNDAQYVAKYAALTAELSRLSRERDNATTTKPPSNKPKQLDFEDWKKQYKSMSDFMKSDSASAAKSAADEFGAVMSRINAKDTGVDASFWKDLNTLSAGRARVSVEEYVEAVKKLIGQQKFAQDSAKAAKDAEEAWNKEREKAVESAGRELATIQEAVKKQREHNEEIGLTAEQLATLVDAREQDAIATKEQEFARAQLEGADIAQLKLIDDQIYALRELRKLKSDGAARQAVANSAKQAADDWKRFSDDIERSLTDALMRGFESGESFGSNFVKSLENMLKTAVLKIAVQAVVQPIMGGINGALGIPGASGAGGAGSLLSLGSNASSLMGSGSIIGGFSSGYSSMVGEMAAGAEFMGPSAALAEGSIGAGASLASALGPLASAMPYVAAALAVASMLKSDKKPAENTGDTAQYFSASGGLTNKTSDAMQSASVDQYVAGMEASYLAAAKNLGIGTVATSFGMGSNTGKQGENPNTIIWGGAGAYGAAGSVNSGEVSSKDAAAVSLATSRAIFAALQGSDIPEYLKGYFNSLTAATASQSDIDNAMAFGTALKSMREQVAETRMPAEILADQIRDLDRQLGTSATTMDAFKRDMKAAIDAGRVDPATLASWQQLQGYIAQSGELAAAVAAKQHDLDLQLLDATGKTAEATAARRADALKVLDNDQQRETQQQIWNAQDAAAKQTAIAKTAQQAASSYSQQYASDQASAAQQVKDAWKGVAESILDTVRQLRGEVLGEGERGFSAAQADYAVTLASAKAGNQEAAGRLPDLAMSLVEIGKVNTHTAAEQALLTARTMASLQDVIGSIGKRIGVKLPAFAAGGEFDGGLRLVGEGGPELEATGPSRIFSASQTRNILGGGGDMVAALQSLLAENRALRQSLEARLLRIENHAQRTAKATNGNPDAPIPMEAV